VSRFADEGLAMTNQTTRSRLATGALLAEVDPQVAGLIVQEARRQSSKLQLIPSENYASRAVMEACGSVLTNKYSEGYPGRRYYEGQQVVDQVELLAIRRAKDLFGVEHANVQPYSGSPANLAVYLAYCRPGDTVMGMALPMGGHLTHGWNVSITGKWFHPVQYTVRRDTGIVDLDEVRDLARRERPKLIFCGGTAIPRTIDFAGFAEIAREVRHTAATAMLRAGSPLTEVGQVLRHRSSLTTAIYAKVDRDALAVLARPWPVDVCGGVS